MTSNGPKLRNYRAKLSLFSLLVLIAMVVQCITSITTEVSSSSRGPEGGAEPGVIASLAQQ